MQLTLARLGESPATCGKVTARSKACWIVSRDIIEEYNAAMKNKRSYRAIAEYYDAENEHHRVLEEDVPFFLGQLPKRKQEILELAVGTARAAIPLAQAGHSVVGVDYAADMLRI